MGRIVIACYRPKPGQESALHELVKDHLATLQSLGLATSRSSIAMRAKDGTFVEVFEWVSAEAIESAHSNPEVLKMWDAFGKVCDYIPIAQVPEASEMFSNYTPVQVND